MIPVQAPPWTPLFGISHWILNLVDDGNDDYDDRDYCAYNENENGDIVNPPIEPEPVPIETPIAPVDRQNWSASVGLKRLAMMVIGDDDDWWWWWFAMVMITNDDDWWW